MSQRKFILNSTELGRVTLENDPIGWDEVKTIYARNIKYLGVFRKRTAALKFVGDGLEYCVELERLKGTEAVMNVIIQRKVDYEDAWELEYEGIGKFNPFILEWDNDLSPSVSIEFEDSGFHNKFLTRADMLVNIGREESIEGLALGAMPTKDIQVHQRRIQENNQFQLSINNSYYFYPSPTLPDPYIEADPGHVVPAEKIEGDTDFINTASDYLFDSGLICDFITQPTAFKIRTIITGSGHTVTSLGIGEATTVGWYLRTYTDDLLTFVDTPIHEITGLAVSSSTPFSANFDVTLDISLNIGQAFTIIFYPSDGTGNLFYDLVYTVCSLEISLIQNFNEYVSKAQYRHEFMKRLVQIITDQEDCFSSTVFGRNEIGYLVDGPYSNNAVFNGKQLRGFDEFPTWSFDKTLKSVRSIWNVGCGIEKISGRFKVVVEELPYFFRGDISVTLHNVTEIKRDVNNDFTFSEVRVGYEKAEYEQVNGLEEYNNKCVFSTFIKSEQRVLDLISPERADGYGMEFARRKSKIVAASEDTPYDNEVFTVMVNEVDGVLRTQKDENYSAVDNIQSPETATNLDITPQRNLIRNGDWVQGCCNKYPLEFLTFVSADKPTDLSSVRTGETGIVEQTSIQNQDLISSLWLNKNYLFKAPVTPAEVLRIEAKPGSLIKFSPFDRAHTRKYFYGWVLDIAVGGKDRTGTFTLLAANVTSDRLHIIDPDGIDNTDQSTPLPPSEDDGGFEYSFEHVLEG